MKITSDAIDEAQAQGILQAEQAHRLRAFLRERARREDAPRFAGAHVLYYLGGFTALGAMTLFMTLGWQSLGHVGRLAMVAGYLLGALALTEWLLRRDLRIPAGILATLAVAMVPLGVYALQDLLGYWPSNPTDNLAYRDYHARVDARWLLMEVATLAGAAAALWRYRLPFLVLPLAVTLWYVSLDLTPLIYGQQVTLLSSEGAWVSGVFGVAMVLLAVAVDLRSRPGRDYAFWLYLYGVLSYWSGLASLLWDSSEGEKFAYLCANLVLIFIGAALGRRVFAVFGGLGVAGYLGYLSFRLFPDSLIFTFALTAIGLLVIGLGILWQRHERAIGRTLSEFLPPALRESVARRQASA